MSLGLAFGYDQVVEGVFYLFVYIEDGVFLGLLEFCLGVIYGLVVALVTPNLRR